MSPVLNLLFGVAWVLVVLLSGFCLYGIVSDPLHHRPPVATSPKVLR